MSIIGTLYRGENDYGFMAARGRMFAVSGVVMAISIIGLFVNGFNLGIEFEGGTAWDVPTADLSVSEVRDALRPEGLDTAEIKVVTSGSDRAIKVEDQIENVERQQDIARVLADLAGVELDQLSINSVGPSWGDEISGAAQRALVVFFVLIAAYIALRFEWKMAAAAMAAVIHDIVISVGFYAVFQFPVTPATIIAFLTILGYSLYDTIVVFDRVQETEVSLQSSRSTTYGALIDRAMNDVMMRSINTSVTSVLPVISLLLVGSVFLGATTLQEFAVALMIGLLTGAYSSIFVAAPLLAMLKEREPRYADRRRRIEAQGLSTKESASKAETKSSAIGDSKTSGGIATSTVSPTKAAAQAGLTTPPRGRKQRRKKR